MSADRWSECPLCLKRAKEKQADLKKEAEEAYGKVPVEDYLYMRKKSEAEISIGDKMREDYRIGISESGNFVVSYSASCHECEFEYEYCFEQTDLLTKFAKSKR